MSTGTVLSSDIPLPGHAGNLATMLAENAARFTGHAVFRRMDGGRERSLTWEALARDLAALQEALGRRALAPGDRVAILSSNREEMLELELAVMSMGAVAVPIFAGYPAERADRLVRFADPRFVAVADQAQYDKLAEPGAFEGIIAFDAVAAGRGGEVIPFDRLAGSGRGGGEIAGRATSSDSVCLMMYTSGTTGKPKLVRLTHGNILSQQAAMRVLWKLSEKDRFLSYLPWHHSFGGIFEKYAAITNGAVLSLEHGFGKEIDLLLENWVRVRPTCFFSVPRIYQEITSRAAADRKIEKALFHDELRFVFTAAAPLPKNISDIFERKGVPVYEGWGLTETSPCCTVTDPSLPREEGVVGKPIPGVSLRLAGDGEILVRGPNVMQGYFRNVEETARVLGEDGWFATGDVGALAETGLRLIARKDRIFKLSNAEMVIPTEIENLIVKDCAFLSHAFVTGSGRDYPVALLFPNRAMFRRAPDRKRLREACECPGGAEDLSRCLGRCLKRLREKIGEKYARPRSALLIDRELTIESEELTPSMKLAPGVVAHVFRAEIEAAYGEDRPVSERVFVIPLE